MTEPLPGVTDGPEPDACVGRGDASGDHCCYINGAPCVYLETDTVPGRRYVCGIRRRLGSWEAVHADPGYRANVQAAWDEIGIESCGAWQPPPGQCCREPRGTAVEVG